MTEDRNMKHRVNEKHDLTPLRSAALNGEPVPERILIVPWGEVESRKGAFVVDDEAAAAVLAAFQEHGTDLPIDYEHQTLGGNYASPNGQAPAAGWITGLEADPSVGVFALVNWTDPARRQLAARQYRYLSPVAIVRKADRKMIALHSVALTNKPAMVGALPIVNGDGQEDAVDQGSLVALRAELSLSADASDHELMLTMADRIRSLESELASRDWEARIDQALRDGRMTRRHESWARKLLASDAALFEEWLALAEAPVALGRWTAAQPGSRPNPSGKRDIERRARSEYAANPLLHSLTSEQAYVALAIKSQECGTSLQPVKG